MRRGMCMSVFLGVGGSLGSAASSSDHAAVFPELRGARATLSTRPVLDLSASVLRASVQVRACPVRTLGLERKDQHKCTQVRARVAIHSPALPVT